MEFDIDIDQEIGEQSINSAEASEPMQNTASTDVAQTNEAKEIKDTKEEVLMYSEDEAAQIAELKISQREQSLLKTLARGENNPYTNKPFDNLEEYRQAVLTQYAESAQAQAANGLLDPEETRKAIDLAVNARLELERFKADKKEFEFRQISEFGKQEFNSLKKFGIIANGDNDILSLPNGKNILRMWTNGAPLAEAYEFCNKDIVIEQKTKSAKQAALNAINSKSHLVATTSASSVDVEMPQDIYSEYKRMFPKWSDKQIKDDYKNLQKYK